MKFRSVLMWCVVAAVLLPGSMLDAHEIGTTRVTVDFQTDAAYEIEIITDAAALVEKLETVSGRPPSDPAAGNSSPRDAAVLQALLKTYDETFRRRMIAAFDGTATRP